MEFDPVFITRLEYAVAVTFHIVIPTFTIGVSTYIATLLVMGVASGRDRYQRLAHFWTRIFAVLFVIGAVSDVVLFYQFDTNWGPLSAFAGDVIGPLIRYEVLTAFFLEATFVGVLLFRWRRVPNWLQIFAAVVVAVGAAVSTLLVVAANSWIQTPAGHEVVDAVAVPIDWWSIVLNPSFPYRLAHIFNAAYLTAGFVVLAIGARYLLADRHPDQARTMMRMALGLLAVLAPLQFMIGNQHSLNTLKHQPMKIAAITAHWNSGPGDFHILAWPDEEAEVNRLAISIPQVSSLILTHRLNGQFPGLKEVPPQDRPPVKTVFFAFRLMLAIGLFMVAISLIGAWLMWHGILFETRWYLRIAANSWWTGFVAVIAGWIVTESGRQPWAIYGLTRTAELASPAAAPTVAVSLALFVAVYSIAFAAAVYYINRLIAKGPQGRTVGAPTDSPSRPLSSDTRHEALARGG